jgi:RNA polymerase sigma-70 factor, ECF subfamily
MNSSTEPLTQDKLLKEAFQYQAVLVAYAYARLKDYHLAEEVIQDTLLFVMQRWQEFQPGTSVYAWTRQIAHFKILEALRRRRRTDMPLEDERLEAIVDKTLAEGCDDAWAERQRITLHALQECISLLNSKALWLLREFYYEGKSYPELAALRGQTIEAIRKGLFRCRQVLQECISLKMKKTEFCR